MEYKGGGGLLTAHVEGRGGGGHKNITKPNGNEKTKSSDTENVPGIL